MVAVAAVVQAQLVLTELQGETAALEELEFLTA